MDLEIPDAEVDGWRLVAASGEIDVATAPALRGRLNELVDAGSIRIVVDLEDVDFIDSTGLGVLVGGLRRARTVEGELRLVCTNARVLKVFEATGLHEVFTIASSVDDAVTAEAE